MAFIKKNIEKKGLTLTSLIDIIFLLLIFSLVTLPISQTRVEKKRRGDQGAEFSLPETGSIETEETGRILQTLLFQIELSNPDSIQSPKIVYILWPSIKDSLNLADAKIKALRDSLFSVFPDNFLKMNDLVFSKTAPCSLIRWAVHKYKEDHFFKPDPSNSIEIRADRNTEFRIVNFIMEQCSTYGDTIPRVVLRTLAARENQNVQ
jgi:biopolymer transport protein ExbD